MFSQFDKWNRKNRIKNMVWTVAEDHSLAVDLEGHDSHTDTKKVSISDVDILIRAGAKEEDAYDSNMYAAAHEGAHVRLSDVSALKDVLTKGSKSGADLDVLNGLCQVAEDYRVDWTTTKERPGYQDLRNNQMKSFVDIFGKARSGNTTFDTTKAISAWTYGIDMRDLHKDWNSLDWETIVPTAEELMAVAKESDSSFDVMNGTLDVYNKHFKRSSKPDIDEGDDDEKGEDKGTTKPPNGGKGKEEEKSEADADDDTETDSSSAGDDSSDGDSDEEDDSEDTEDDSEDEEEDEEDEDEEKDVDADVMEKIDEMVSGMTSGSPLDKMVDDKGKGKLDKAKESAKCDSYEEKDVESSKEYDHKRMEKRNPKSVWTEEERKNMERMYCRGIHEGTTLWYADAVHKTLKLTRGYVKNLDNQAKVLGSKLKEDMRAAKNSEGYISDNGTVIASACYRATKLSDNRVFYKNEYDEEGGYAVELLLDASGSQGYRTNSIRDQSFIIARACSYAGIPCRVISFQVYSTTTLLERHRDFDDPTEKDLMCFDYEPHSDNRDGLAIKVVADMFRKRHEPNKIMIVLSDGEPADGSGDSVISRVGGLGHYASTAKWKGDGVTTAVMDTARTIRDVRRSGIPLMGVYVGGGGKTLENEKLMYGNDFAYIQDMDGFVSIVGNHIHKQILKLE